MAGRRLFHFRRGHGAQRRHPGMLRDVVRANKNEIAAALRSVDVQPFRIWRGLDRLARCCCGDPLGVYWWMPPFLRREPETDRNPHHEVRSPLHTSGPVRQKLQSCPSATTPWMMDLIQQPTLIGPSSSRSPMESSVANFEAVVETCNTRGGILSEKCAAWFFPDSPLSPGFPSFKF